MTLRVAKVPLNPTSTVPQTSPATHTQGSSVYSIENSRRASSSPMPVAPSAAKVPDKKPRAANSAATPCSTVRRLAPRVRSMALS